MMVGLLLPLNPKQASINSMYQAEGKQFCIFTTSTESYALTNFSENKRSLGQEPLEMNGYRSGEALL
jgi:hypothetical protein